MNLESTSEPRLKLLASAISRLKVLDEAERLEASLIEFYRAAWPVFDPAPYVHGWHLEAIADHLEAVSYGQIRRLLVNIPPRHSKTLLTSVAWPAWLWAKERDERFPLVGPQAKFLCLSYASPLALDSALSMRRLVESDWYQERWGYRFQLTSDQEAKSKFDTTAGGTRISSGFDGTLTGRGGDAKIIDDPHKADEAESDVARESVIRKYDGTLKSRVTDPRHTAEAIIMQRLHERDLSGHVLAEKDPELVHLVLPAEYEAGRKCYTVIGWEDPRTIEGEALWGVRFGPKELAPYKRNAYEWAGQWQQRPEVRGGAIIKREYWQLWSPPDGKYPKLDYVLASADTAYTEKEENDPTGFVVIGTWRDKDGYPKIILLNAWRKRLEIHGKDTERKPNESEADWIKRTRERWGLCEWIAYSCKRFNVDRLIIEGKASGLSVAQEIRRLYSHEGWGVLTVTPEGDKVARTYAVQSLFADGLIYAPDREWAQMVIDEMAAFPKGTYKDLTDAMSQALKHLRTVGLAVRREERLIAEREEAMYHPPLQPIYDI